MADTPDPSPAAAPEPPQQDRFSRVVAVALGVLFVIFGLTLITIYFVFSLRAGVESPQQMAQFGVFFAGIGLSVFLSIIFREAYNVRAGNLTFAGTLAATAIFAWVAWPYLFPEDKIEDPAQLGSIKFSIECDRPPISGGRGTLVATLEVPDHIEEQVMESLAGILGVTPLESDDFIHRDANPFGRLDYFRDRHILKAANMRGNEIEVPGTVRSFSVVNVLGLEGTGLQTGEIQSKHLFDIALTPSTAPGVVDVEVIVDLSNNDRNSRDQDDDLACDITPDS